MRLTFVTDMGQNYVIEVDPQMELENIMALLEADSGIPPQEQSISIDGRHLGDPKATLASFNIGEDAVLLLRRKITVAGRPAEQDSEMMRLQLLGDPNLLAQLRQVQPDLAAAAANDPARFAQLMGDTRRRQQEIEQARQQEYNALLQNPFDVEAQRKIEEEIRMQAVLENLNHAMEYSPEAFGKVHMLYVPVEVNGHPVKAFVDSGAQQTIMSPHCAEACGIMRLIDKRFSGIAKGVGTAKILGRVHSAQMKVANVFLPCAFTILEGREVDLLLGLDMLKAHQACIDLEKNVLRIQGCEVSFLPEHELPSGAFHQEGELVDATPAPSSAGPSTITRFPGTGNTVGASSPNVAAPSRPPANRHSRFPESDIAALVNLGATRDQAIANLEATGGNVDAAASLIFSSI